MSTIEEKIRRAWQKNFSLVTEDKDGRQTVWEPDVIELEGGRRICIKTFSRETPFLEYRYCEPIAVRLLMEWCERDGKRILGVLVGKDEYGEDEYVDLDDLDEIEGNEESPAGD